MLSSPGRLEFHKKMSHTRLLDDRAIVRYGVTARRQGISVLQITGHQPFRSGFLVDYEPLFRLLKVFSWLEYNFDVTNFGRSLLKTRGNSSGE